MSEGRPASGNAQQQNQQMAVEFESLSDESESSDTPFFDTVDQLITDIEVEHDVSKWPFVENLSLVVFTLLQASGRVFSPILVRLAHKNTPAGGQSFLGSTVVLGTESVKVFFCCLIIPLHQRSLSKFFLMIYQSFTVNIFETLKVSIPAFIYVIQNNLYYYALQRIDASLFALTYQLRILTTALLMMVIMGRRFTRLQWLALLLSLVGAVAVQMGSAATTPKHAHSAVATSEQLAGLSAVLIMCLTNGFGGVYLEAVLKKSEDDIFLQNIRLSLVSLPKAAITMVSDLGTIRRQGFFCGWNAYVWIIVLSAAFGGVVVSAVIKYADNIKKSFCQALALGGTAFVSVWMGDSTFTVFLLMGVLLVVSSVIIYSTAPPYQKKGQLMAYDQRSAESCSTDSSTAAYQPVPQSSDSS